MLLNLIICNLNLYLHCPELITLHKQRYSLTIGFPQDLKKGFSWFDNDGVLFLCVQRRKFAVRRSQAIPLLHTLDGFMYRQTREGPVCRSILQPQVYHQLLLCE